MRKGAGKKGRSQSSPRACLPVPQCALHPAGKEDSGDLNRSGTFLERLFKQQHNKYNWWEVTPDTDNLEGIINTEVGGDEGKAWTRVGDRNKQ